MNDNFKKTNHISMLQQLLINGSEQTIMINGDDRSNPLLLFLHGGPARLKSAMRENTRISWKSISPL